MTLGTPRAVTLVYNSTQAQGVGFLQVDATDTSSVAPTKMSIQVYFPSGSAASAEIFYQAGSGAHRLGATWTTTTSASVYRVVVRSYWTDGTVRSSETQLRALVIDEQNSPFGAGWWMLGLQRIYSASDGSMVVNGDGTATFFTRACGNCAYQAEDGEFSTLVRNADSTWVRTNPDGTKANFSTTGLLTSYVDRVGNQTTFAWQSSSDGRMHPLSITDPVGKQITFSYYASGYLAMISDPTTRNSQFGYDTPTSAWDLGLINSNDRQMLRPTNGTSHRLSEWTDPGGGQWNVAYDQANMLASITAPTVNTSDAGSTRPVTFVRSLADAVLPASGQGTSAAPGARVDPTTVRVAVTDPRGNVVRAAVDRYGAPTRVEEPYGRVSTIERDAQGRLTRTVSPAGGVMRQEWSGPDVTKVVDDAAHDSTLVSYESTYHLPTRIVHGPKVDSIYYGALGLADSTVSRGAQRTVTRYTYATRGRVATATDPEDHGAAYVYDDAPGGSGNATQVSYGAISAGLTRSQFTLYDSFGRDTLSISPNADSSRTTYDLFNRVVRTISPTKDTTWIVHDSLGVASVTDAKHQVYAYARNLLGWTTSETDPRGGVLQYQYDRAGNQTGMTNRRNQSITLVLDSLSRVITRTAGSQVTSWSYDPAGLWVQVTNAEGTDSVAFDATGRMLRAVALRSGAAYRVVNEYDAVGNRTRLLAYGPWSGAHVARFHHNADFRLDSIVDFSGRASTLGYNPDGELAGVAFPGDGISRGYSSVHAPYEIIHDNLGLLGALDIEYSHDQNGLIGSRIATYDDGLTTGQLVRTYSYDRKGQLAQVVARKVPAGSGGCSGSSAADPNGGACVPSGGSGAGGVGWSWDRVGNPTGTGITVQTGNRLTVYGGYTMEYDDDGNLTRRYSGTTHDQRLYWNALGQLDSVVTNGVKVAYGYNGFGQRIRRTQGSTTTRMLYDGDDLLMELDASGNPLREYTYYPGIDDPHSVYKPATGGVYYYSSDYPGSVTALTTPTGAIAARYNYAEFGATTVGFDSVGQPLKYMAREYDDATGMYYMRARWYHPVLSRFVSEDPLGLAGGINMFQFSLNRPTSVRDPSGTEPEEGCEKKGRVQQAEKEAHACPLEPLEVPGGKGGPAPLPPSPKTPKTPLGPKGGGAGGVGGPVVIQLEYISNDKDFSTWFQCPAKVDHWESEGMYVATWNMRRTDTSMYLLNWKEMTFQRQVWYQGMVITNAFGIHQARGWVICESGHARFNTPVFTIQGGR